MSSDTPELETFTKAIRKFGVKNILNQQQVATILNISMSDFMTIQILEETGPITAGELASKTGLTTGSVTALINRLEADNYVKRANDAKDRRKVLIVPIYDDKRSVQFLYENLNIEMLELIKTYDEKARAAIIDFLLNASDILEKTRVETKAKIASS